MKPSLPITTLLAAAACGATRTSPPPIRNIYTFPPNTFIENIAVRSNSHLLLTSMSVPDLYTLNPLLSSPTPSIVHTFPNASGISGIAEVTPDLFAVITAVWDLAATRALPGTLAVWTVSLATNPPTVRFVTSVPESPILNGLTRHPTNSRYLLAADSALGALWRVDLATGGKEIVFQDALLTPTGTVPGTHLGINGLRSDLGGKHVYFTNSARKFLGRVEVDGKGGVKGGVQVLANSKAAGADVVYDDLALDVGRGVVWVASHPSYAVKVMLGGPGVARQEVLNHTVRLLNPTSAAFGRGGRKQERTLYVTNGGEFVGLDLMNEGVVALDLS
ncbi:hypothetical protein C8A05DRAFT_17558 [Staphylotrichum tortipilum]|uniref:SMP-30/Gluconolactonase/LRE-like region domain-containing protein n=1 Tax=Staphylotrichum tortipilum TaxID=2831512 RepID=A0AAN6MHB2_9PEZI|nr:hypothetical protein C8A05DRAFT_17558 [Staphylotrichum longicolle]